MKASNKKKLAVVAVAAAFGGVMYLKNRMSPKYADDYPYSFVWEGDEHGNLARGNHRYKRVKSLKDLVRSQISHYKTWDGRAVAETLVQLFLMKDDKKHFDKANTLMMLSQLAICGALGKASFKKKSDKENIDHKKAALLAAGFFACAPHLAATCLWLTGSMNYLWVGVMQSCYVLQFAKRYHDHTYRIPSVVSGLLGFFAGASTETGAGAALMLSGMGVLHEKKHRRPETWMYVGLGGCIAGLMFLLLAPGNRVKLKIEKEYSDTLPVELTDDREKGYLPLEYLYTPLMFKTYFKEGFLPTVIRELPLQLPVLVYLLHRECHTQEADRYLMALESAVWAVPTVMLLSPEYPKRSTYPSVIYLLAAACYALEKTGTHVYPYNQGWFRAAGKATAVTLLIKIISSLLVDADIACQMEEQLNILRSLGKKEQLTLPPVVPPPVYSAIAGDRSLDLENCMGLGFEESDDPYNLATARYYGVKDFRVDYDADHPYLLKGRKALVNQLVKPVKSFWRQMKKIFNEKQSAIR